MPVMTAADRLQGDIENICEMVKDDVDAALWHWSRSPALSIEELESAAVNLQTAIALMKTREA